MSRVTLEWHGDQLIRDVRAAARDAVNDTVDAARDDAKATHEEAWVNRPTKWSKTGGQLQSEIVSEHADVASPTPTASFGFARKRGFFGLFHEVGTVHEYEKPALRPAADRQFPTLPSRIRERLLRRWLT